jgi:Flp pilus assembly pilin Flp
MKNFLAGTSGLETSEYAVAAALIIMGLVLAYTTLSGSITGALSSVAGTIN